jgi:hypothetical protein
MIHGKEYAIKEMASLLNKIANSSEEVYREVVRLQDHVKNALGSASNNAMIVEIASSYVGLLSHLNEISDDLHSISKKIAVIRLIYPGIFYMMDNSDAEIERNLSVVCKSFNEGFISRGIMNDAIVSANLRSSGSVFSIDDLDGLVITKNKYYGRFQSVCPG